MDEYLSGTRLIGGDYDSSQVAAWYADEEDAYANLGAKEVGSYKYEYHELNAYHGYRYLRDKRYPKVLGLGSAYGDEFLPIIRKIGHLDIVEASQDLSRKNILSGVDLDFHKPDIQGFLHFGENEFDLICCFGVLHHIPKISRVMEECNRVLKPGGKMLVREPINSMGDWSFPRPGLTARERGIPREIFRTIVEKSKFKVLKCSYCDFHILPRIAKTFSNQPYNSRTMVKLDSLLCRIFTWNYSYHRTKMVKKLAPSSVFYVLEKTG